MKKGFAAILTLLFMLLAQSCAVIPENDVSSVSQVENKSNGGINMERRVINHEYIKAIWLSQFDMERIFHKDSMRRYEDFTALINLLADRISEHGFNTVFLQIRPNGDSFFKSSLVPASKYVTGAYGRAIEYDALAYIVTRLHKKNISVHAWINPLRLMTESELENIENEYPVKELYRKGMLTSYNGRLYLDPGLDASLDLIFNGAREALELYSFDGLHIDDYFYPTHENSFDAASFKKSGFDNLTEYRENNINRLVHGLYQTVKAVDNRLVFGVSPAGNLKNVRSTYYADVEKWCSDNGYIDYIVPQLYYGFLHGSCPFDIMCDKWNRIIKNKSIKLVIGITLEKAFKAKEDKYAVTVAGKNEWILSKDILKRELLFILSNHEYNGYSVFSYKYLINPVTNEYTDELAEERENFLYLLIE